jgi:hypothetical protein
MNPEHGPRAPDRKESLRLELAAIAVLYAVLSILPLLIGFAIRP